MKQENGKTELQVLVEGDKILQEYPHEKSGGSFLYADPGESIALRVRNYRSDLGIVVILSLDGLSVDSGQPASGKSLGYVISPNSEVTVPYWQRKEDQPLTFCLKSDDPANRNSGVIGMKILPLQQLSTDEIDAITEFAEQTGGHIVHGMSFPNGHINKFPHINHEAADTLVLRYGDMEELEALNIDTGDTRFVEPVYRDLLNTNPFPGDDTQ